MIQNRFKFYKKISQDISLLNIYFWTKKKHLKPKKKKSCLDLNCFILLNKNYI